MLPSGDWFKVERLVRESGGDDVALCNAWNKIGGYYSDRHKWLKAAQFYTQVCCCCCFRLGIERSFPSRCREQHRCPPSMIIVHWPASATATLLFASVVLHTATAACTFPPLLRHTNLIGTQQ